MKWPDDEATQKATGRRDSSVRRLRDGLRPFLREFHDRPIDSFSRDEAVTWTRPKGANVQQAVRQFFNHALDRDLIERNQFTRLGASKRKRRVDRPDFEIITDEQYERLRRAARESRPDDYGLVLEGATMAVGEAAMRPGEVFALHRPDFHWAENLIHVRRQIDLDTGKITWPKDDDGRWVVMSPAYREHMERMRVSAKSSMRSTARLSTPRRMAATCGGPCGTVFGTRYALAPGCPVKSSTS
jgi:integrase